MARPPNRRNIHGISNVISDSDLSASIERWRRAFARVTGVSLHELGAGPDDEHLGDEPNENEEEIDDLIDEDDDQASLNPYTFPLVTSAQNPRDSEIRQPIGRRTVTGRLTTSDVVTVRPISVGIDLANAGVSAEELSNAFSSVRDAMSQQNVRDIIDRSRRTGYPIFGSRSDPLGIIDVLDNVIEPKYSKRLSPQQVKFFEDTIGINLQSIIAANPNKLRSYCKMLNVPVDFDKFIKGGDYLHELRTQCKDVMGYPKLIGNRVRIGNKYLKDWHILRSGVKLMLDYTKLPSLLEVLGRYILNLSGTQDDSNVKTEIAVNRNIERRTYDIHVLIRVPDDTIENAASYRFDGSNLLMQIINQQTERDNTMTAIMRRMVKMFDEYSLTKRDVGFKEWVKNLYPENEELVERVFECGHYKDDFGFEIRKEDAEVFLKILNRGHKVGAVTPKGRRIKITKKLEKDPD